MTIKILGSGCPNCKTLEHRVHDALQQLDVQATVEKVQDIQNARILAKKLREDRVLQPL